MARAIGRISAAVTLLAVIVVAAFATPARQAFACSVNPDYNPVESAPSVVLGRIISFGPPLVALPGSKAMMTVEVEKTLSGVPQPATIDVITFVTQPGVPRLCMELDPAAYEGRRAVIALGLGEDGYIGSGGQLDTWVIGSPLDVVGSRYLAALYDQSERVAPGPPDVGMGIRVPWQVPVIEIGAFVASVAGLVAVQLRKRMGAE